MSKSKRLSVEDFLAKLEWEGGIGALAEYFSLEQLESIDDPELSRLAIAAKRAMDPLQEYLDRLEDSDLDEEE